MVFNQKRHTSIHFDDDIDHAIDLIKSMGELVQHQLSQAVALFREPNKEVVLQRAKEIIEADSQVNELEVKINDACLYLIAKHQPRANDLRLVFALLKTSSEFERIGDTVTKICDTASSCDHVIDYLISKIEHFAQHTLEMLHKSMEALLSMDLTYATEIYVEENYRAEYKEILDEIIREAKNNVDYLKEFFKANIAIRQIERIGDRCRNINEFVYYYVKGHNPSYKDIKETYDELHCDKC